MGNYAGQSMIPGVRSEKRAPRKTNPQFNLARWFWTDILNRTFDSASIHDTTFRMLTGQAKRLLVDGNLDAELVRETIREMIAAGRNPNTLNAVTWAHQTGVSWYEYIRNSQTVCPPVYQVLEFAEWQKRQSGATGGH